DSSERSSSPPCSWFRPWRSRRRCQSASALANRRRLARIVCRTGPARTMCGSRATSTRRVRITGGTTATGRGHRIRARTGSSRTTTAACTTLVSGRAAAAISVTTTAGIGVSSGTTAATTATIAATGTVTGAATGSAEPSRGRPATSSGRVASGQGLGEALDGLILGVEGVEDGHQSGDRQQVVIPLVHVQQFQAAGGLRERAVACDQLAEPSAVDIRDFAQVHNDREALLLDQAVDLVFQTLRILVDRQVAGQIQNRHLADVPFPYFKTHIRTYPPEYVLECPRARHPCPAAEPNPTSLASFIIRARHGPRANASAF